MDRFAIVTAPEPARRVSKKSDPGLGLATRRKKVELL